MRSKNFSSLGHAVVDLRVNKRKNQTNLYTEKNCADLDSFKTQILPITVKLAASLINGITSPPEIRFCPI